jgi:ABC-2 type transport system permease protein
MFAEIFRFECRVQRSSPLFVIVALVFGLLAYLAMASENVTIGGGTQNLDLNAPFTIVQSHFVLSVIAMFACAAFIAVPLTRDTEQRTAAMLVATGVPRLPFLFGRVTGGALFASLAACASILGTWLGTLMPWLDQERIGAVHVAPYWFSVWAVMVPNVLIIGGFVAAVAALTRSLLASYVVLLAVIIADIVVQANADQETLSRLALLDPFGISAFANVTRYWTVFDKNTLVPAMSGTLLWNRLLWLSLSGAALAVAAWRYRLESSPPRSRRARFDDTAAPLPNLARLHIAPRFDAALVLRQIASQIGIDLRGVLKSYPFYVLLLFGMVNVIAGFFGAISEIFGTPVLPVTRMMLSIVNGNYSFIVFFIVAYYAGELMHRERQLGVAEVVDATPFPNGVMVAAKILCLWFIIAMLFVVVMATAIAVQAGHGYFHFELGRYAVGLFVVQGWTMYLLAVLAVAIQAIVSNKFLGMLLLIVLFLGINALGSLGFEHVLYQVGVPQPQLSDMNGWGHFVEPMVTVGVYWSLWMVLVGVAAHLFMRRGATDSAGERLAVARLRVTRAVVVLSVAVAVAIGLLGAWIFYNTNVLNRYETAKDAERLQAEYERRYRQYKDLPMPEVVDLDADVAIFPGERRIVSRGTALVENVHDRPIDEVDLTLARPLQINALTVGESRLIESDVEQGYYRYALAEPLQPGATLEIRWDLSWRNPGFVNSHSSTRVVGNGTFVNNTEIMPLIGYDSGRELVDNNKRRKHDLPPAERLPKYATAAADAPNQFGVHRRTRFHTVVSTSSDQIAIAPGYLERDWIEGDRHYFEYAMDAPIWPFVSYQSARYAVARDRWRDVDLAVFYHPPHAFNVQRMIETTKQSLDYFTREFGPYQYRQFRILEFPAYERFAQSFPNTIPYSEGIGFIADLSDPKRIDYVFYVTAHELAHQWWGHQLVGRRAQGETLLVETLAQYSALMVMEHAYGPAKMRRFLKYELDSYLANRGGELIEELPLARVEDQPYVHYRKGSLAMYALKDAIGEDAVNRALRNMLARYGRDETSFPLSGDLIDAFRAEAPTAAQALITALFEKITLWDLAVTDATVTPTDDGRYRVRMSLATRQFEADGAGHETEVPLDIWLDVGVFPAAGDDLGENDLPAPLLLDKRHFDVTESVLEFVVDERPERVGIDPYNKLIDRNPDDNLRRVDVTR